jgi:hypothetical protein
MKARIIGLNAGDLALIETDGNRPCAPDRLASVRSASKHGQGRRLTAEPGPGEYGDSPGPLLLRTRREYSLKRYAKIEREERLHVVMRQAAAGDRR